MLVPIYNITKSLHTFLKDRFSIRKFANSLQL